MKSAMPNTGRMEGPPSYIMFPGSQGYMTNFMSTIFNVTDLMKRIPPLDKNRMVLVVFTEMESLKENQVMPKTQIQNLTQVLTAGQCKVTFSPFFMSGSGQARYFKFTIDINLIPIFRLTRVI